MHFKYCIKIDPYILHPHPGGGRVSALDEFFFHHHSLCQTPSPDQSVNTQFEFSFEKMPIF